MASRIPNVDLQSFEYREPSIYFNEINSSTRKLAAPQEIGGIWNVMKTLLTQGNRAPTLEGRVSQLLPYLLLLGLSAKDVEAQKIMAPIVDKICRGKVIISASPDNAETGIFFVIRLEDGKKIAVVKIGEVSANMTLAARLVAKQLGLPETAICGIFCSIKYPQFPTDPENPKDSEDFSQELFSGLEKTYELRGENLSYGESVQRENLGCKYPPTLTGILVPFLEADNKFTIEQIASLLIFNLAAGVRDTKIDAIFNFKGSKMMIDTADCMPRCFIPPGKLSDSVSSTQINWLDELPLSKEPIPTEILKALVEKIEKSEFNVYHLLYELSIMPLRFPDLPSEGLQSSIEQTIHLPSQDPELQQLIRLTGESLREDLAFLDANPTSRVEELINEYLKMKDDDITSLKEKLMIWNPDLYSEDLYLENLDTDIERYFKNKNYKMDLSSGFDHGGCYVTVRPKQRLKGVKKQYIDQPEPLATRKGRLMSKERIDACQERVERLLDYLRICIEEKKTPTCHEIAKAIDPFFAHVKDRLENSGSRLSMSSSSAAGDRPISSMNLGEIDPETEAFIRAAAAKIPSPSKFTDKPPNFPFESPRNPVSVGTENKMQIALDQSSFNPDLEVAKIFDGITPRNNNQSFDEKKEEADD
jgi:hypothetical protein